MTVAAMRYPFVHDNSDAGLTALLCVVVASDAVAVVSLMLALLKRPESTARAAAICGAIGLAVGFVLCQLAGWHADSGLASIGIAATIPISSLGLVCGLRKGRSLLAVVGALLAFALSPVLVRHSCGLGSWPIEWALGLLWAAVAFVLVSNLRRLWLAVLVAAVVPVASLWCTAVYLKMLHSPDFPGALLDARGRAFRAESQRAQTGETAGPNKHQYRMSGSDAPADSGRH